MQQRLYKAIFWIGYFAVLITTFIPLTGELNKIYIGPDAFHIRLDHMLHLLVYFMICMYYLYGQMRGITLFRTDSLLKFVLLILLLAIFTEVVQLWVPERAFNVFDLVSNVAGLILGVGVVVLAQWRNGVTA